VEEGKIVYVYDGDPSENIRSLLRDLEAEKDIEVTEEDASEWSRNERWDFYLETLIPLSIDNKTGLEDNVEKDEEGTLRLSVDVLIINDKLYLGREAGEEALKEELGVVT